MNSTEPRPESASRFLSESGLLPNSAGALHYPVGQSGFDDWMPLLHRQWQREADGQGTSQRGRRARKMAAWLDDQIRCGAQLRDSWSNRNSVRWIGHRFQWWAPRVSGARHVAIFSSRLGRKLDQRDAWFNHLRATCSHIDLDQESLLCVARTTTARYVRRCGEIFGCQVVNVDVASNRSPLDRWWKLSGKLAGSKHDVDAPVILPDVRISPEVVEQGEQKDTFDPSDGLPLADRVLAGLADRLIAIHVRPGGNIHELLRRGLQEKAWPTAAVWIALGRGLVEASVADELMSLGAVGWNVQDDSSRTCPDNVSNLRAAPLPRRNDSSIRRLVKSEPWSYLTHCTRRRHGPWPDQSDGEFLDDLILARDGRNHSELASLQRILRTRRLQASTVGIRGGTPVVSFTDVPLWQINQLRRFRSHRGRWDFLPYGICIDLQWLKQRGARPVCYGDETNWSELPESERPYFQKSRSGSDSVFSAFDWTIEREWRHIGNVDLNEVPVGKLSVFVPSLAEARQLVEVSRWPILVVENES